MKQILRKGLSKDKTYISVVFEGSNEKFVIYKKEDIYIDYGAVKRSPDFFIKIFDKTYACFFKDKKCKQNRCYMKGEESAEGNI